MLVCVALAAGAWWGVQRYVLFNAAAVIEGEVYRSAQPSPAHIEKLARKHGIGTVVSLMRAEEPLFRDIERDRVEQLGLEYRWVPVHNLRKPTRTELLRMIEVVEETPRPLLVHCMAGADRSGVISAMFRMHAGDGFEQAVNEQLSLRYLHTGVIGDEIADVVAAYRAYCREAGREPGGWEQFKHWVRESYPADPYDARLVPEAMEVTLRPGEHRPLSVAITNDSRVVWPDVPGHPLGLLLYKHPHLGERVPLHFVPIEPHQAPGQTQSATVVIDAGRLPIGRSELMLDILQRDWTYFGMHGSKVVTVVVNVVPDSAQPAQAP